MPDSLTNVEKFTFSNFTNCKKQGHGGEANVYKGLSGEYGDVAIKEFFIEVKVDDMSEVELLIKSRHPNIVQLYGVLVAKLASPLIQGYVMEYMPTGSLEDVIHNPKIPYSWNEISSWIQQISRGLGYLHGRKIIHRDIKPSNLLLGNGLKTLKISDFGMAKQLDVGSHTSAIGTCWYMAPEIIRTRKYSFSADIYSLAITIWELFCRKRPYYHLDQSSQFNLLIDVVGGKRPLFAGSVGKAVITFLTRAWTANPEKRPALAEFLTFAETPDVQINWNINGREQDAQQTSVSEVPMLIGGQNHHFSMEILDVEANTWKQLSLPLPYEAMEHRSAFLDGEIYLFGGLFEKSSKKYAYKLTKEMKWTTLPDMIDKRFGISNSTVVFDGCIWVIGGKDRPSGYLNTVEAYHPKSNCWIRKPSVLLFLCQRVPFRCLNEARAFAAAAVLKGKIFVCGGYGGHFLNSVEYFDPLQNKWIFFTRCRCPRLLSDCNGWT